MSLRSTLKRLRRWLWRTVFIAVAIITLVAVVATWAWQHRPEITDLGWPDAVAAVDMPNAVTVTWLGVTTMLIDDGVTQLLIDGYFTRPKVLNALFRKISTDTAGVNHALAEYRINRLAAVIPSQSHFDHAMDIGVIANRSSAVVLGSESSANIVIGAALPIQQYQILADRESRSFGNFTITLLVSAHAPVANGQDPWFSGKIASPLQQPAHISEWKEGQTYSIHITHPRGSVLIQSSGGYIDDNLRNTSADVVILGIGGLASLGKDYVGRYWQETVHQTGATRVFPVHYDDFTQPFGTITPFPALFDDVVETATWINEFAAFEAQPVIVERLPFGARITLF